jgi:hypothetical protein
MEQATNSPRLAAPVRMGRRMTVSAAAVDAQAAQEFQVCRSCPLAAHGIASGTLAPPSQGISGGSWPSRLV